MGKKSISFLIVFDILFILVTLSLIIWATIDFKKASILVPAILILYGFALLGSKKLRELFFVERFFYWLSNNVFVPKMKSSHLIWGFFSILLGLLLSFRLPMEQNMPDKEVSTPDPAVQNLQDWWYKDPMLWIVILLLIAIVVYRIKKKSNDMVKDKNENNIEPDVDMGKNNDLKNQ